MTIVSLCACAMLLLASGIEPNPGPDTPLAGLPALEPNPGPDTPLAGLPALEPNPGPDTPLAGLPALEPNPGPDTPLAGLPALEPNPGPDTPLAGLPAPCEEPMVTPHRRPMTKSVSDDTLTQRQHQQQQCLYAMQ